MDFKAAAGAVRVLYERPLVINAYVEIQNGQVAQANWGDDLNYFFFKYLTKREISIYFDNPVAVLLRRRNYLCIGSTLNYLPTKDTVVWGAGVIDDKLTLRKVPREIRAVRGPLTREYLLSRGIPCPDVYGDPALLIPYFYRPSSERRERWKIGIVPHYADIDSAPLAEIRTQHPDIQIIDTVNYGTWTDFIDRICACDVVLSSSLHGLIVAEAYGIPSHWISMSNRVIGNGFKFRDFYASLGKAITQPAVIDGADAFRVLASGNPWSPGELDLTRLLSACPFDIKEPIRHEHPLDIPF